MNFYHTIERPASAEYKDRGSRFIAFAFPIASAEDFKKRLKEIKDEHPKASHHCFAWRMGTDGNQFRSSDDGEPSGTAGKPILGQIDSRQLTDTAVVVVRYFGDTLLGVPGLIQAYKTATSLCLQLTPVIEKPVLIPYELEFDYTMMNEVMMVVKRFGCLVLQNEMQLFCRMRIGIPKATLDTCTEKLEDIHGLKIEKLTVKI
ncbi:MAG: IMPACT family protein [Flavisolibacter sp.]